MAAVALTAAMMMGRGGTQTADAGVVSTGTAGTTQTPAITRTAGTTQTPAITRTVVVTPTVTRGGEGCTPGYWKAPPHHDSWGPTGYTTGQTLESVFDVPDAYGVDNVSLLAAMSFGGGPTTTDAAKLLLHHAVAGLLNSAHPDVDYDISTADLIADVNAALATDSRNIMLGLKSLIDAENNSGCPLN
jgi:hypothetical protein